MSAEKLKCYGTGKRKTAVARVWITSGKGTITVNGQTADDYFHRPSLQILVQQPLKVTDMVKKIDIWATVEGGGKSGQAGALRHGIARALVKYDESLKAAVKSEGLLTRDARMKERKKYGQPGARKRFQFSKR